MDRAWFTFSLGYAWASLLIAIPAGGFLLRLFMIQAPHSKHSFGDRPLIAPDSEMLRPALGTGHLKMTLGCVIIPAVS